MPSLRFAFRLLAKTPGFSAVVVSVLALGVGATTAMFSVVYAVLLHPFPYVGSENILFIGCQPRSQDGGMSVTYPDFLDWQTRARTVENLAYANGSAATLTDISEPAVVRHAAISAAAWDLLGIQPLRGRIFSSDEDRPAAHPVCVLSHATWQSRFGGDEEILGHSVTLDGRTYTVVGVMLPEFKFWAGDVWTPIGLQADTEIMRSRVLRMDSWVVGRPKAGKNIEDVSTELNVIADQLAEQYPESNRDVGVRVRLLSDSVTGGFRLPLLLLLGAVGCVLLIACANVANLLLARTATRQREYAVRAALGATRWQLVRQMLLESLPLGVIGGAAGLLLGNWGLDALLVILPTDAIPAEAQIRINVPVMFFSLGVTLGTMLLFTLLPAIEGARTEVNANLQEGARGTSSLRTGRIRAGLIVAEVALSLVLLLGAGLLTRSLARLQAVDPGFDAANLLLVPIQLAHARYTSSQQATAFFEEVAEQARRIPGVESVAASTSVPFSGGNGFPLIVEGRTYTDLRQLEGVRFSAVMGDHLRAHGLRLRRGRGFEATDRAGAPPVIILNEAAVQRFLPDADPIGKRVMLGVPENLITPGMLPAGLDKFQWATVIGIVDNARHSGLQNDPQPAAYIPIDQSWDFLPLRSFMFVMIRTTVEPMPIVPSIRGIVSALDHDQPIGQITTMEMTIAGTLRQSRFNTVLLGLFATVALVLAVVGIYGVVAWNVTQRTREIGIRQALGANPRDVLRLVVGQGMRTVALGLGIGLLLSLLLAWLMRSLVFGLSVFDPLTFVGVLVALSASALGACVLPARRATRVDPLVALRAE